MLFDVPLSVPFLPQVVGMVSPTTALESLPPASRFHQPVEGDDAELVDRHSMPSGSRILNWSPMTCTIMAPILG